MTAPNWTPKYQWVCHACQASNSPGLAACSKCGFPVIASKKEIDVASPREQGAASTSQAEPKRSKSIIFRPMEVEHLAHWKQAIAFVLWGVEALCIVAIYISFSWAVVVASIFILLAAEALYQLLRKFPQGGYS